LNNRAKTVLWWPNFSPVSLELALGFWQSDVICGTEEIVSELHPKKYRAV
jgi:hypothetical protein